MKPNMLIRSFQHENAFNHNTVQYWGFFTHQEIKEATQHGKLLMLDIDFGRKCSLHCPSCFRRKNLIDNGQPDMDYNQLLITIRQAKQLGLRSVKICGAGEPFENPKLLQLAHDLTTMDVGLAIFTKGHVDRKSVV